MAHGVVFFRDQDITPIQQRDFAARSDGCRTAKRSAFLVEDGVPEMHVLINDRERTAERKPLSLRRDFSETGIR